MPARITTAIALPAFDAMNAAPGTVFENLHVIGWRVFLQERSVVCDLGQVVRCDVMERIRKRHLAMLVMMAVTLAVGSDVHQLRPVSLVGESAHQSRRELLPVFQQTFERHGLR